LKVAKKKRKLTNNNFAAGRAKEMLFDKLRQYFQWLDCTESFQTFEQVSAHYDNRHPQASKPNLYETIILDDSVTYVALILFTFNAQSLRSPPNSPTLTSLRPPPGSDAVLDFDVNDFFDFMKVPANPSPLSKPWAALTPGQDYKSKRMMESARYPDLIF
jgi:hypothetical protein